MLMDLKNLEWDPEITDIFGIPISILPEIRSCSEYYGECKEPLVGVPICGILGDQQAALFGQTCYSPGEAKNTYGTGCFLLLNCGEEPIMSQHGLLTTVAYQIGQSTPKYALEGSVAITGALVQWLRDNLGLIKESSEIESLAREVEDNGGIYFVPAFSGLYAPYWKPNARGIIAGLTRYITKAHLARAVLEATAFQSKEILDAMEADTGINLTTLKVDGGMVVNDLLMQFQADLINVPVIRPTIIETTALGAAYAAGLAVDYWNDLDQLKKKWKQDKSWMPDMADDQRRKKYREWKKAVSKSFDWVEN
jgi:glycerol kinase